jgi:hypothetical protein
MLDFGPNDVLQFDIERTLTPEMTLEVTEYPVESGSVYSDSTIRKPRTWNISALVSNTPITDTLNPRTTDGQTRVSAVWSRLVQAWQLRQTCAYSDDMDSIPVVAIESVSAPRSADNQNALDITVTLKEIITATAQRAKVRIVTHNGKRQNRGQKAPVLVREPAAQILLNGELFRTQTVNGLPVAQSQYQDTQSLIPTQNLAQPQGVPTASATNIPPGGQPTAPDVLALQAAGWR